ncbi:DUF4244 domain-containing protein [Leucobacter aridicollis]|uniref:DUF4244 domain-containing protein n=1 Tax=Leucobacter aridicollis TaxID=283878 RepID=UPI00220E8CBD|nr:DUF4244 domain-containing protein [Leucobacter aridicollis]
MTTTAREGIVREEARANDARTEREVLHDLGFPVQAVHTASEEDRDQRTRLEGSEPAPLNGSEEGASRTSNNRGRRIGWARRGASLRVRFRADERGAVTAEYALVIMAAVAFAGLLIVIMRSEEIRGALLGLVQNALGSAG